MKTIEIILGLFFVFIAGTLIYLSRRNMEAFLNGSAAGNAFAPRCGVDFPACPTGMKCINGYCAVPAPPVMPANSGLPVWPLNSGGQWGRVSVPTTGFYS